MMSTIEQEVFRCVDPLDVTEDAVYVRDGYGIWHNETNPAFPVSNELREALELVFEENQKNNQ